LKSPDITSAAFVKKAHSVFAMSYEFNFPDIVSVRHSSCPIVLSSGFVPIEEGL